ncbi:MAG TPA: pyridoxamine 5'-phosphate oxidase family protein [Casimicrobiaceae bacterium]|nr:pyridoxamine 5'-phosphate oxidase family protein [Casimicrobiaceae bacterium]
MSAHGRQRKVKELWNAMAGAWFPHGPDDPNLGLLRIDVERGEYWDPGSSKMVRMLAIAKAAITHSPPKNVGEHREFRN